MFMLVFTAHLAHASGSVELKSMTTSSNNNSRDSKEIQLSSRYQIEALNFLSQNAAMILACVCKSCN